MPMMLTKHAHACVSVTTESGRILVDPGAYTRDAAELIELADAVLISHAHHDHFDEALIARTLAERPELQVFGPDVVVGRWTGRDDQVHAVAEGDAFELAGVSVSVHGSEHAPFHPDIATVANVGFCFDGRLYHPGDAYFAPDLDIETLLLPVSGPWINFYEAVEFLRRVGARRVIQIHEIHASELGQQTMARFLGPEQLGAVPVTIVPVGETVEI